MAEQGTPLPAGQYPLTLTAASLAGNAPVARSTVDNRWSGETVYVQVCDNYVSGEPTWSGATLQTYTVAEGGTMSKGTVWADVFWQTAGEQKAIRAWYVGGNTVKSGEFPASHTVATDQSGEGYAQSDFLYAGCISGFAEGKDGVNLSFYHQVAKLTIKILRGDNTPADFSVSGLTIGGVATQGTYTAPTTFVDNDDSRYGRWNYTEEYKNITPHKAGYPENSNVLVAYKAIVIPQEVKENTALFTITAEGYNRFAYTIMGPHIWKPGREYTYNITIKGDRLEVSASDGNIGWDTNGATGSGEAELP